MDPDVLRTHEDLGEVSRRFLEFVLRTPEACASYDYRAALERGQVPDWEARFFAFDIQAWPLFVAREKLREMETATVGVTELLRRIPERLFDSDPRRFAEAFGIDESLAVLLLEPPTGLDTSVARCDIVESPQGVKVIEVNLGANIGGWELRIWKDVCLQNPAVRQFVEAEGISPRYRDPVRALFRHVVRSSLPVATGGELNVAFAFDEFQIDRALPRIDHANELLSEVLAEEEPGCRGRVLFGTYPDGFKTRQGSYLYQHGVRIHALAECCSPWTPREVFRCFKGGTLRLFNGPLGRLLGNKRMLSLLSRSAESDDAWSDEERKVIRNHVPWSRDVTPEPATFRGERAPVPDLLLEHQEEVVVKKGDGSQGSDVYIGRFLSRPEWRRVVQTATREDDWMAQEYVVSRPYLLQHGEGACAHDVAWGTFCFGKEYGGAFLRVTPQALNEGPINAHQGAAEAFVFEV